MIYVQSTNYCLAHPRNDACNEIPQPISHYIFNRGGGLVSRQESHTTGLVGLPMTLCAAPEDTVYEFIDGRV